MTDHRPIPVAAPAPYLEHPGDPTTDFRGWITKFDCYLQLLDSTRVPASGLTDKQKNALLFMHLGVEGERIFSTHPRAASRDTLSYNDYSTAVKEQFQPRVTHLKASFDFHRRLQLPGESVDAFVCALRSLIADCDYADPSQHLLEQLVAGCHDKDLQRDLLAMPNPAFDRCLEKMRASEMATREASDMAHRPLHKVQGGPRPTSTPASNRRSRPPNPRPQSPPSQRPQSRTSTPNLCIGCGRKKDHPRAACPAFDKECSNCHRLGHFAAACRQKGASKPSTSRTVTEGDADIKILNSATPISTTVDVSAGSRFQPIQFEVDTGASPTIMPWSTFRRNFPQTRLQTSGLHLKNYDGSTIQGNRGWFLARIVHGSVAHQDRIYVLQDPAHAVLGKNFLQPLQMVIHCNQRIVRTVQQKPAGYLKDFPVLTATNLGTFPGYQHRIQLSSEAVPHIAHLRSIPFSRRDAVNAEIRQMDAAGIWEPVQTSQWAHGLVTVPKADGGVRITTDLTPLNPFVIPQRYPLPNIKDLYVELAGATVFTKLDLKKGYFHIPLHPDSRDLTTTLTPLGLRRYKRLPMGLKDSASVFQRLIHQALAGIQGVIVYIDDIVIYGKDLVSHDRALRRALSALADHDFRLQLGKCTFAKPTVTAFGHLISHDGLRPHPSNLQPIKEAATPRTIKEVQAFLGMINFYQDFLPGLSDIAEPLRALTRKDTPFEWTDACNLAFKTLKRMAMEQLHLHIFDPRAPTFVTTDASDVGIGATLTQTQDGKERPIACFNKTLSSAERNYAANEREALACLLAMEHWEKFLLGKKFTLRTDHKPLKTLLQPGSRRQSSKFERWRERLSHFDFDTQYLPGPQNQTADALSRLHEKAAALDVDGITLTQLQLTEDPTHTKIKEALRTGWPRQSLLPQGLRIWHQHRHQLRLQGDILMWDKRIVPPEPARTQILQQAHRGHPGIVRMKRLLRQTYWWPGMQHQVESFVKFCHPCQRSEKSRPALPMPTTTIPRARTPAKQWALDITGPFWNGRYLVVALDAATNFPEVLDTTTTTSTRIIQWLKELFARYGNPDAVLTDNGRQFTSQEFQTFLKHLDIHHYTSSVYNPQENGQVERFNKYLKYGIQTFGTSTSWEEGILGLLKAYRLTPAKDNGDSPAASFLGHEVRGDEKPNMEPPVRRTLKPQPDLKQRTQTTHHVKKALYKIGDRVLSKLPHVPKGQSPYSRPKTITEVVGYYTFRLDDGQVWNARKLRPFRTRPTQTSTLPDTSTGQPGRHLPQAPPTLRTSTRTTKGAVPQRYGQWVVHRLRGDHAVYGGNTQYRKFQE